MEKVPDWLSGAVKTSHTVKTSNDVTFELYSVRLKASEKFILGANGQYANYMNYIVLASEAGELTVRGDVNADGEFSVADLVLLQEWLLAKPNTQLADWQAGDLCEDGRLDTFDIVMMRRELLGVN